MTNNSINITYTYHSNVRLSTVIYMSSNMWIEDENLREIKAEL